MLEQPDVDLCCQGVNAPAQVCINVNTLESLLPVMPIVQMRQFVHLDAVSGGMHGKELPTERATHAAAPRSTA